MASAITWNVLLENKFLGNLLTYFLILFLKLFYNLICTSVYILMCFYCLDTIKFMSVMKINIFLFLFCWHFYLFIYFLQFFADRVKCRRYWFWSARLGAVWDWASRLSDAIMYISQLGLLTIDLPPIRDVLPLMLFLLCWVLDYIQCPYCQRRFNENAADRHINFCKEQAARISNKGKYSTDSKGKPASRPQVSGRFEIFL